jgi:tRNA (guanine-N7-)-methyltransferase
MTEPNLFAILPRLTVSQCAGETSIVPGSTTIEVDVGCGKGRFLLARASRKPSVAFLGIDCQAGRIHKVACRAERAGLRNVRLLQLEASYVIEHLLPPASVSCYYVFFPDPWPKRRHQNRRLFDAAFLASAWRTLVPGGCIHVATDDTAYFEQIVGNLTVNTQFVEIAPFVPGRDEQTNFERLFSGQGKAIRRCSVRRQP